MKLSLYLQFTAEERLASKAAILLPSLPNSILWFYLLNPFYFLSLKFKNLTLKYEFVV